MLGQKRLWRQAAVVSFMTLISRLFGFVRDLVMAMVFGATAEFDVFVVVFRIPNLLRSLFAEGAFAQAFVPVLAAEHEKGDKESLGRLISGMGGLLTVALLAVVLVVEIASSKVVLLIAPGFSHHPDSLALATHLLRWVFPYLFFISLVAFIASIFNAIHRFGIPAITPVLLNITMIVCALWWAPHVRMGVDVLAISVLIAGVLQLLWLLPFWVKSGWFRWPRFDYKNPLVRRVLKLMLPALFGVSVSQLSLLIDNIFASYLPTGSISWLYYSDRLTFLPLGLIGVAMSTIILPTLSKQHAKDDTKGYAHTLAWSMRVLLLLGVPAMVGLTVLSGPIISTLIQRGAFHAHDVLMAKRSLSMLALGLPAFMIIKVVASAFYAKHDMTTPAKVAFFALLVNVAGNFVLMGPLKHAGLALSTSVASWGNALVLWYLLGRKLGVSSDQKWLPFLWRVFIANAAMAVFVWWYAGSVTQWLQWSEWMRIVHLCVAIGTALILYAGMIWALGIRKKHWQSPS